MIDEKKLIDELDRKLYAMQIVSRSMVLDIIKEQPKVGEWIPCSERLPVPNEFDETGKFFKAYLVQDKRNTMYTALWNGENWVLWTRNIRIENVVAWMPLPEPYKAGDKE